MRAHTIWTLSTMAALVLGGCGSSPTGPSPIPDTPTPIADIPTQPAFMHGWFVSSAGAPSACTPGSTMIVVPSYDHDPQVVADAMTEQGCFAWVSAHYAFQGPHGVNGWEHHWRQTVEWMRPIQATGRLLGVFVLDEPFGGGYRIRAADAQRAMEIVQAAGYQTMAVETYQAYKLYGAPYAVNADYFGVTYFVGGTPDYGRNLYQQDSALNIVFAPREADQAWCDFAREDPDVEGCFVWSLDMGGTR